MSDGWGTRGTREYGIRSNEEYIAEMVGTRQPGAEAAQASFPITPNRDSRVARGAGM